jgi:SHS2 domain-containing protein
MSALAGHRLVPHTADCVIEAWGPDRPACLIEALLGLVEGFAQVAEDCTTKVVPIGAGPGAARDVLVSLFEDVIFSLDVFSVVPVRFHLAESEDGGIAGDMEVVPCSHAIAVGPVPKGVSYHELFMGQGKDGWRCRVLVDV